MKRFTIFLSVLMLVLFNLGISKAQPNFKAKDVIVVAPHGGDYSSINEAIDNANAGDTIYVKRGSFDESVKLKDGIYIYFNKNSEIYYTGKGAAIYAENNTNAIIEGEGTFTSTNSTVARSSSGSKIAITGDLISLNGPTGAEVTFGTEDNETQLIINGNIVCYYGPALFISDDCYAEQIGDAITYEEGRGGAVENWGVFKHSNGLIQHNGNHLYSIALAVNNNSQTWLANTRLEVANLETGVIFSSSINNIVYLENVTGNVKLQANYSECTIMGEYIIE